MAPAAENKERYEYFPREFFDRALAGFLSSQGDFCVTGADPCAHPGQLLIMTGFAGMSGACVLCREKEALLRTRFSKSYLSQAHVTKEALDVTTTIRILKDRGIRAVEAGSGGVFAALFRLSKEDRVGFTVDMKAIPILQQTVEILSFLGGNPYRLYSRGTVIASVPTEEVSEVLRALEDAGVSAGIIGRTEKGVKKILLRGDEVRYLERTSETFVLDKESGI